MSDFVVGKPRPRDEDNDETDDDDHDNKIMRTNHEIIDGSQDMSQLTEGSQHMDTESTAALPNSAEEPMVIAIENQLLEPIGEDADESDVASIATGISAASSRSIESLANTEVSFANSLASESSFTMAPSAENLLADFYEFWKQHQNIGYTAVMVAFISFAYSKGINGNAITEFFNKMNPGLNLRLGGADITPITEVINNAVNPPGKAAGGSLLSRISNGITSGISAIAIAVATVIGTNAVVHEPLTIDNVTGLLFNAGETAMRAGAVVPAFISQLNLKIAALKALYKINSMRNVAINTVKLTAIDNAVIEASGVLNDAVRAKDDDINALEARFNAIITTLIPSDGTKNASPGAGAGGPPPKGGKRKSQKQQKQKQQKKTQKQQKKLSKSKRAKKAKQSKKANKKH